MKNKKEDFSNGEIFLFIISVVIGIILLEIIGFTKIIIPNFISTELLTVKLILIIVPLLILILYLFLFVWLNNDYTGSPAFIPILLVVMFSGILIIDHNNEQDLLKEKDKIKQEITTKFTDYENIPESFFRTINNKEIIISFEKSTNGIVVKKGEKRKKDNNIFFIKKDLATVDVKENISLEEVDEYIQKEIIQKFTNYDEIEGTYYSPVGNKYIDVEKYEDNKILKVKNSSTKYMINKDLSYSKIKNKLH